MTPFKKRSCAITQRLAEDLMIRNMAEATIDAYTYDGAAAASARFDTRSSLPATVGRKCRGDDDNNGLINYPKV